MDEQRHREISLGRRLHGRTRIASTEDLFEEDADAFAATATVEVRQGVHVPDSATITISEAGKLWIASGSAAGLERTTLDQRRQHLDLHVTPFVGSTKLSKVTVPFVRSFQERLREASGLQP